MGASRNHPLSIKRGQHVAGSAETQNSLEHIKRDLLPTGAAAKHTVEALQEEKTNLVRHLTTTYEL